MLSATEMMRVCDGDMSPWTPTSLESPFPWARRRVREGGFMLMLGGRGVRPAW